MMLKKFIFKPFHLLLLFNAFMVTAGEQPGYPTGYFASPLQIPLRLSGNFGEIRPNHFHSGLDFKTDSVQGKAVLAAADGFVSRIKVSASGFGKALYITHPNGFVTVYAHLHHFADSLNNYIEKDQYNKESFETELFPEKYRFPVKKGEIIAWSGNTGGSEGPHLHFEIRDEKTEKPINPLFFGFDIIDTIPPVLTGILFKSETTNQTIPLNSNKTSDLPDTIALPGRYGMEFMGFDLANNEPNHLGIYSIALFAGDSLIYSLKQITFAFNETRYVNAHIDYERKLEMDDIYERCYRLPGDFFSLNPDTSQNSFFEVAPGKIMPVTLLLQDYHNNTTTKKIIIKGIEKWQQQVPAKAKNAGISKLVKKRSEINDVVSVYHFPLKWNEKNKIKSGALSLNIPAGALYQNEVLKISTKLPPKPFYKEEKYYSIAKITPLHLNATIAIHAKYFPDSLRSKAIIAYVNENQKLISAGGVFTGDTIATRIKTFGLFTVTADSVPPEIENYIITFDSLFNNHQLAVKITDNLSGIDSYNASINGKWILMEFDEKTSTLFYAIKDTDDLANKIITIEVTDKKGNRSFLTETIKLSQ